ncbi:MAG TPA: response regulator transcription factor [Puia sp.]|jgi:DNA-binding NarL/FixJ family response regulator|nr:response regulator transcription factor [Puia sp.]
MEKINVVLIGDQRLMRETCASLLTRNNDICVLSDAKNFDVLMSLNLSPDIVIITGGMNKMHGPDVVKIAKDTFPLASVMGLFMNINLSYARKMMKAGMKAYLTDDSSINEIFAAIEELCRGKEYICDEIKTLLSKQILLENNSIDHFQSLSSRELQIINFVRKGSTSKDIAAELNITFRTVETHRHNILKKLNIKNSSALVNYMSFAIGMANAV